MMRPTNQTPQNSRQSSGIVSRLLNWFGFRRRSHLTISYTRLNLPPLDHFSIDTPPLLSRHVMAFEPNNLASNLSANLFTPRIHPVVGDLNRFFRAGDYRTDFTPSNTRSHPPANPKQWRRDWKQQALPDPEQFLHSTRLAAYPDLEIPLKYKCAISLDIMTTPVYDKRCPQQKFELSVIKTWLAEFPTHPVTRQPLSEADLVVDTPLQKDIAQLFIKH